MYILLLITIIVGFIILLENIRECRKFRVTEYEVKSAKVKHNYKVVYLTDLHNKEYDKGNQKLLGAIRKVKPDFVFVGGDMILKIDQNPVEIAYELMKALVSDVTIYYANGNHEQYMKEHIEKCGESYNDYKKSLEDLGVIMLENDSVLVGDDMEITGVEIPCNYYTKFCREQLQLSELEACITKKIPERYQILMAHNPTFTEQYVRWGADLTLSGHYHGGMIRLPYYGGIINPQAKLFPSYTGGHYKVNGKDVIVSKGLGEHTVKVRINNIPEIIVLQIQPE